MDGWIDESTDLRRDIAVGDYRLPAPAGGGKHRNIEQLRKRAHAWGSERRNTGSKGGGGGGGVRVEYGVCVGVGIVCTSGVSRRRGVCTFPQGATLGDVPNWHSGLET